MGVLKYLRVVEKYGEGVDRMIEEMEARLMAPPTFLPTDDSVTVVLHNRTPLSVEDQAWLALLADLDLSPAETRLVVEARRRGTVARRELEATLPGVDVPALLRAAVARGLVVQQGQRGGARYALSDEIVLRPGARGIQARDRRRQTLLDELRRRGQMTTPEAAEFLGDSDRPAVRALLDELVRAGEIEAVRSRRRRSRRRSGGGRGSGGGCSTRGLYRNQSELALGERVSTAAVTMALRKLRPREADGHRAAATAAAIVAMSRNSGVGSPWRRPSPTPARAVNPRPL